MGQRGNFFKKLQSFAFWDTHSAHACIDLEVDRQPRAGGDAIEIQRFLKSGNRRDETAFCDCLSFLLQSGTKNDDRMQKRCAQFRRFCQIRDAK
jgi:hypothetical protein